MFEIIAYTFDKCICIPALWAYLEYYAYLINGVSVGPSVCNMFVHVEIFTQNTPKRYHVRSKVLAIFTISSIVLLLYININL